MRPPSDLLTIVRTTLRSHSASLRSTRSTRIMRKQAHGAIVLNSFFVLLTGKISSLKNPYDEIAQCEV